MPKVIIRGDSRHLPLRDSCVDCVVTSPPYFGLRDYGNDKQLGLEASPADYVAAMVDVFREVRRVLSPRGTVWLNLGDSYAGSWGAQGRPQGATGEMASRSIISARQIGAHPRFDGLTGTRGSEIGLKPKDLMMVPARVALALQADGWYLRSDIIWSKQNCMPESVGDRPTRSHEYLFLLAASERYYYDAAAIAEPLAPSTLRQAETVYEGKATKDYAGAGVQDPSDVKARIVAKMQSAPARARAKHADSEPNAAGRRIIENVALARELGGDHDSPFGLTRNKRTVWHLSTQPYAGAHFATMPEKLVEPCILAGCPLGGLVLDPFAGSGTVLAVAQRLGRRAVGVELAPHYLPLMQARTAQRGLLFGEGDNEPTEQAGSTNAVARAMGDGTV